MFKVGVHQKKTRKLARIGVVLAVLVATCGIGLGLSAAAAPDPCGNVWKGATPNNPLSKTADPTSVHPGDTVTYTFTWNATGDDNAALEDCYRVDDGSDATLNALVSGFYHSVDIPNVGGKGAAQTYAYTITIPNDSSLVGHSIVNRAKMTHGSVESRTDLVSVAITCATDCGGGTTGGTTGDTSTTGGTTGDTSTTGGTTGDTSTTGGTTGDTSTTGGTTGDTSTTGGTTNATTTTGGTTGSVGNEVLGRVIHRKPLATTGSETTALAWLGLAMLMIGVTLRFGRFGTREVYATGAAPTAADMLAKAIRSRSRDWTCRR